MAATLISAVNACLRTDTALHLGRTLERPRTRREEHLVGRVGLSVDGGAQVASPRRVSQQLLDGDGMAEPPQKIVWSGDCSMTSSYSRVNARRPSPIHDRDVDAKDTHEGVRLVFDPGRLPF